MTMSKSKAKDKAQLRKSAASGGDPKNARRLTSERISADLADFALAGGEVEVLGTTRVLTKFDGNVAR
jgi:hypothetical protein